MLRLTGSPRAIPAPAQSDHASQFPRRRQPPGPPRAQRAYVLVEAMTPRHHRHDVVEKTSREGAILMDFKFNRRPWLVFLDTGVLISGYEPTHPSFLENLKELANKTHRIVSTFAVREE